VTAGEKLRIAPIGLHDPELFVDPGELTFEFARHGVRLRIRGIRPTMTGLMRWIVRPGSGGGRPLGRMVPTRSTAILYQGMGHKEGSS
jgi:2-polyprenyl-6-hydroxyphenyl methylase/3-demethylubiquinone-9 3-methyltransferase